MTVGRNDPCPCGSGDKYKKCCLGKSRSWSTGTLLMAVVLGLVLLVGGFALWASLSSPGQEPPSRVWSPEHGHYH